MDLIMTEQEHLECEIKELELEIKSAKQTLAGIQRILEQKQRKHKEMNHRTPPKYNVDYIDDKIVIVNGVQYQRVEEPKTKTLYDTIFTDCPMGRQDVCDAVEKWLSQYNCDYVVCPEYLKGYNALKETLKANLR
jgi:hypothetical protein